MVLVSRSTFDKMRDAGLIHGGYDKNYVILNKDKNSRRKKYYVAEESYVISFLKDEIAKGEVVID